MRSFYLEKQAFWDPLYLMVQHTTTYETSHLIVYMVKLLVLSMLSLVQN